MKITKIETPCYYGYISGDDDKLKALTLASVYLGRSFLRELVFFSPTWIRICE